MDMEARAHSEHPEALRLWLRLLTCTQIVEKQVRTQLRERFDTTLPRFDLMAQLERAPDGLKFRIGGFAGKVLERMGGVPQNIPGGEIYTALEKGTIDAAEWIGPYDDQKLGFNKVAPYYYYPGWWEGGLQLDLYINQKAYDALSAENKAIVEMASTFAHVETQAKYDVKNPNALKQLVGNGAKLRPFPADVMAEAFKQSMSLYDELSAKNENWRKVYADFARFRSEQNLWFRFTEATFDRFMQSQKL